MKYLRLLLECFGVVSFFLCSSLAQSGVVVRTEPLSDVVGLLNLDLGVELGQQAIVGLDYGKGIRWMDEHESLKGYLQLFKDDTRQDGVYGKFFFGKSTFAVYPSHTFLSPEIKTMGGLIGYQWVTQSQILWTLGGGLQWETSRGSSESICMPAWEFAVGKAL